MAANSDPIYSKISGLTGSPLIVTAATTVYDISGTIGTDIYLIHSSDVTNGGYVQRVRFKYAANGTTTSVGAVIRLWIASVNSGTPTIGTNAWFWDEVAVPATGVLTNTTVSPNYELPMGLALPASYYLLAKITVSQTAGSGWLATTIAGKY